MTIYTYGFMIIALALLLCQSKNDEIKSNKNEIRRTDFFSSDSLKRFYCIRNDTAIYAEPYLIDEYWITKYGNKIGHGNIKNGRRYSGRFLIYDPFPVDTEFYFVDYHHGQVTGTEIPEWENRKLGSHSFVPFIVRSIGSAYCSESDSNFLGFIDSSESRLLQMLSLPSFLTLTCNSKTKEAYRFYYLSTWKKPVIFDLLFREDSQGNSLHITVLNGSTGYPHSWNEMFLDTTITLNYITITSIRSLFDSINLFNAKLEQNNACGDGTSWLIEGLKKGVYGYRSYWCSAPKSIYELQKILVSFIGEKKLENINKRANNKEIR